MICIFCTAYTFSLSGGYVKYELELVNRISLLREGHYRHLTIILVFHHCSYL